MAGLGAARTLAAAGADFLVIEAEQKPGGLAATDVVNGFPFDRAGHFLHIRSPLFSAAIRDCGEPLIERARRSFVMLEGHRVPYPIQFNLSAAPQRLREQVLAELAAPPSTMSAPGNLEEHLRDTWGETLLEAFFEPYNSKLWGIPLSELPVDALGRYVPRPDVDLVRQGAESGVAHYGYNSTFLYPRSGRIGSLPSALAKPLAGSIQYECRLQGVDLRSRICRTTWGDIRFERLISTLPAPLTFTAAGLDVPSEDFACTRLSVTGIGLSDTPDPGMDWIYVPDPRLPFHRIVFNHTPPCADNEESRVSLLVEATVSNSGDTSPSTSQMAATALRYLKGNDLLHPGRIAALHQRELAPAYVADPRRGQRRIQAVLSGLPPQTLWLAGRFGQWDYQSMEESYLSGSKAAELSLTANESATALSA
jgi:protoporphyrinogen oxidase